MIGFVVGFLAGALVMFVALNTVTTIRKAQRASTVADAPRYSAEEIALLREGLARHEEMRLHCLKKGDTYVADIFAEDAAKLRRTISAWEART